MCEMRTAGPPGRLIWERERYSIWEVDGEEDKVVSPPQRVRAIGEYFY